MNMRSSSGREPSGIEKITSVFAGSDEHPINKNSIDQIARRFVLLYQGSEPAVTIALGMFESGATPNEVMDTLSLMEDAYLDPPEAS